MLKETSPFGFVLGHLFPKIQPLLLAPLSPERKGEVQIVWCSKPNRLRDLFLSLLYVWFNPVAVLADLLRYYAFEESFSP